MNELVTHDTLLMLCYCDYDVGEDWSCLYGGSGKNEYQSTSLPGWVEG